MVWFWFFIFAASAKQVGEAQDIIDSSSRSTVAGKRSAKYMYVKKEITPAFYGLECKSSNILGRFLQQL